MKNIYWKYLINNWWVSVFFIYPLNMVDCKDIEARVAGIRVAAEPEQIHWKMFHVKSSGWRSKLWWHATKLGISWSDWHWQWKMAWVKVCSKSTQDPCPKVIMAALQDHALLVAVRVVPLVRLRENPVVAKKMLRFRQEELFKLDSQLARPGAKLLNEKILYELKLLE